MAIQICKHLKLPPAKGSSRVLAEWAFYKVSCNFQKFLVLSLVFSGVAMVQWLKTLVKQIK